MPLYSYACEKCGAEFELLVQSSDAPTCPSCGGQQLKRLVARIAGELKSPALAKAGRQAAAKAGHVSNFSRTERR